MVASSRVALDRRRRVAPSTFRPDIQGLRAVAVILSAALEN